MIDITPIANAVITLLAAIVTAFVVPLLRSKTQEQDSQTFQQWVKILVAAAEQLYKDCDGAIRKKYVLGQLEELGITVDDAEVENAIEAAVLELHHTLYGAQNTVDKRGQV